MPLEAPVTNTDSKGMAPSTSPTTRASAAREDRVLAQVGQPREAGQLASPARDGGQRLELPALVGQHHEAHASLREERSEARRVAALVQGVGPLRREGGHEQV